MIKVMIEFYLQPKSLLDNKRISETSTLPEESQDGQATVSESNIAL